MAETKQTAQADAKQTATVEPKQPTVAVKDTAKTQEVVKVLAAEGARTEAIPTPLVRIQAAATLPEPKGVPMAKQPKTVEDADPGPPLPPVAEESPAPRFIHQNERAPKGKGVGRFKIRCLNYGEGHPTRYVLAASREDAVDHYVTGCGIRAVMDVLRKGGAEPPEPVLSVRVLED